MRRFLSLTLAVSLLVGLLAVPATASWWNREKPANVVDALVERSSANGPDRNGRDFDILIAAAGAVTVPGEAGDPTVAQFLAGAGDITLWAPNDRAFLRLARDLGYEGGEDGVIEALVSFIQAAGLDVNDTLFAVLAYHVTPEEFTVFEVLREKTFPTLQGQELGRRFLTLKDADTDDRNPRITWPLNIRTENKSVIHTIDRVLRPIDLP